MSLPPGPSIPQFRQLSSQIIPPFPRLAVWGDSLMAASSRQEANGGIVYPTRSVGAYTAGLLGGAVRFSHAGNFGISGETTTQIRARIAAVLAYKPAVVIFDGGTNDIMGGVADATIIGNIQANYLDLRAAGIFPIYILMSARDDASLSGSLSGSAAVSRRKMLRINNSIRTWAVANGFAFVDPDPLMANAFTGVPIFGYTHDGLHWTVRATYRIAAECATILRARFPGGSALFGNGADVWATDNETGNLLSGGLMVGTSGSLVGSYATGQVASGWVSVVPTIATPGGTVAFSNEPRPDGLGDWQVITVNGVSGGGSTDIIGITHPTLVPGPSNPIKAGDTLEILVEFGPCTSNGMLRALVVNGSVNDGAAGVPYRWGETVSLDIQPAVTDRLITVPLRFTVPPIVGSPFLGFTIGAYFYLNGAAANEVIRVGRVSLRKVF